MNKTPIIFLTGFLGACRTTLLNHLLKIPAFIDSAVLMDEFGEIALDHHRVETVAEETVVLSIGMDCQALEARLNACALTDAAMALGPTTWAGFDDSFPAGRRRAKRTRTRRKRRVSMLEFPERGNVLEVEEGLRLMPLFDERDLIPCVTQHAISREVLMLGWMSREAFQLTIETGYAHYFSRARNQLWRKGERSGQTQIVRRILVDDDQDCLLIMVALPDGASCHVGYRSCFFRELHWVDKRTDFSLRMLEHEKVYDPARAYGEQSGSGTAPAVRSA